MAYTIISQNNSTTTLSDGVNTITVPSRVNLTSGNFTIVEVNNNMATLEDGDGNVYRDIPCVATLAGEGGGGGSALPDQTGHSGEFLTTDGTDASWSDTTHVLTISGRSNVAEFGKLCIKSNNMSYSSSVYFETNNGTRLGYISSQGSPAGISIGVGSSIKGFALTEGGIKLLWAPTANEQVDIGGSNARWTTLYVTKINNGSDITVPAVAGEMAVKQVNTTITLTAAGWSSNTQTVTVTGITTTGVVLVSPDPTDQSAYTSAGIICTTQAADSLTFTTTNTPSSDIDVVVVML